MKNGMSDWIRPAITKWTKDTDIFKDVSQFFQAAKQNLVKPQKDQRREQSALTLPNEQCKKRGHIQFTGLTQKQNQEYLDLKNRFKEVEVKLNPRELKEDERNLKEKCNLHDKFENLIPQVVEPRVQQPQQVQVVNTKQSDQGVSRMQNSKLDLFFKPKVKLNPSKQKLQRESNQTCSADLEEFFLANQNQNPTRPHEMRIEPENMKVDAGANQEKHQLMMNFEQKASPDQPKLKIKIVKK